MDELFAICRTFEIDDHDARGFVLKRVVADGESERWPIIDHPQGAGFLRLRKQMPPSPANALDVNSGEFMDEAGNFLVCSQHGAQFDLDTGYLLLRRLPEQVADPHQDRR